MAKYLVQGSYTLDGIRGMVKDGGTKRRAVVEQALQSVGIDGVRSGPAFARELAKALAEAGEGQGLAQLALEADARRARR